MRPLIDMPELNCLLRHLSIETLDSPSSGCDVVMGCNKLVMKLVKVVDVTDKWRLYNQRGGLQLLGVADNAHQ